MKSLLWSLYSLLTEVLTENEDAAKLEEEKFILVESSNSNLQEQFSKLSCQVGRNQAEVGCNVQTVNDEPSLDKKLHHVF